MVTVQGLATLGQPPARGRGLFLFWALLQYAGSQTGRKEQTEMKQTNTTDVFAALPTLSRKELQELSARISALTSQADGPDASGDDGILYDAMAQACRRAGGEVAPWSVVMASGRKRFADASKSFWLYVSTHLEPKGKDERRTAAQVLMNAAADRIMRCPNRPVCVKTLLDECFKIHDVTDDAFPGYRESGMLRVLLRRNPKKARTLCV